MALKSFRSLLVISFILILAATLFPVQTARALNITEKPDNLPSLSEFVSQVQNGEAGELRGVYIPEILAAPVVQQPAGNNAFVSPRQNVITQFGLAAQFGSTGLLAHNYLAGEMFFLLKEDQTFYLVFGDGQVAAFVITKILQYQALEPDSPLSNFLPVDNSRLLTSAELFSEVYKRPGNVILQTCIAKNDSPSWGRLFVIAEPGNP